MGEDDPALIEEIGKAEAVARSQARSAPAGTANVLEDWDSLIDRGPAATAERAQATNKMVDVLNRRNYIRNLRDVNEAWRCEIVIGD